MANLTDLIPVSRAEFANELAPCLALASGIGMSKEDQRVWLNAAYRALDGIPIALLKRGCDAAMKTADHPSKIVPAITAEVQDDWKWRKRHGRPYSPSGQPVAEPEVSQAERANVAQSMGSLLKRLQAAAPTVDALLGKKPA
jgi:hypothetical protein